jgi:hypothetical protein
MGVYMDFFNYMNLLPGLIFHPLKSVKKLLEEMRSGTEPGGRSVLYSAGISLAGNVCFAISVMLAGERTGGHTGIILAGLFFSMLMIGLGYFFSLALIYFILSLSGRHIEPGELITLFLSSDFIFVITLPAVIIALLIPQALPVISGLIFAVIFIMNIILKIRSIFLCSGGSGFGSAALFFAPALYIIFTVLAGAAYGIFSVIKLLTYS